MRTKSTCLRNLMAEKDSQHAKRLAEEKEAEAQRAEEARHLATPGSWVDEETITPKHSPKSDAKLNPPLKLVTENQQLAIMITENRQAVA